MLSSLLSARAPAASDEPELLGVASGIALDSIRVGPDGKRFAAVTVDPITNKRRAIVSCRNVAKGYDRVAKGHPIFSPEGSRTAFVASRDGKCFVVVDGMEGRGYAIIEGRWPIADLVFSRGGQHVAYKARKDGKNYLVVDAKEFGPYDDEVAGEAGKVQGIGDVQFSDNGEYFSYRAKTGGGMVACRGRFTKDGEISLTASKEYEHIGAGTPVWLGGAAAGEDGELFAFVARADGKEFLSLLPEPSSADKEPARYAQIMPGSLTCAPNRTVAFAARDESDTWRAVLFGAPNLPAQGQNEWKPCDAIGPPLHSPDGNRWACMARMGDDIVMLVDGQEGPACTEIAYPGTMFAAGDHRVVYVAVKDGQARLIVEGVEGDPYPVVDAGSILFDPAGRRMAYAAGDGKKRFVILDGEKQPAFDRVWNLRFGPAGNGFAYCAGDGGKNYLVLDGETLGPYEVVGAPVFNPDGLTVAWAAMDEDAGWRVYVNGEPGPAYDSIVSRLTFVPGSRSPVYVARILSEGEHSFAMVSGAGVGRKYTSIWMGDGGRLFPRDDGRVEYFAKQDALVYRDTASVAGPRLLLSDIEYEKATVAGWDRPGYDKNIEGGELRVGGIGYSKGIGVCAPSEITYNLPAIREKLDGGGPLRFTATVGIDERRGDNAAVSCSVYAGDSNVASTPRLQRDRAHRFDVAIPPDSEMLRLVTESESEGDRTDWCDWIQASVAPGKAKAATWPAARVDLPARWARLKGEGLRYDAHAIIGWKEGSEAGWDFICPADGTYELLVRYGCHKEGAGSEFTTALGEQSFSMKTEDTGDGSRFKRFSVGKIALEEGEKYDISLRFTKQVGGGMNVRCIELKRKD